MKRNYGNSITALAVQDGCSRIRLRKIYTDLFPLSKIVLEAMEPILYPLSMIYLCHLAGIVLHLFK